MLDLPVIKDAPPPAQQSAEATFEPQNEVEERLLDAALNDDLDAYTGILLGGARVLVPVNADTPWGLTPADPRFPWQPVPLLDRPSIVVFTSHRRLQEAVGERRYVQPEARELIAAWPSDEWVLAVNPGTPVGAALTAEQIRDLAKQIGSRPQTPTDVLIAGAPTFDSPEEAAPTVRDRPGAKAPHSPEREATTAPGHVPNGDDAQRPGTSKTSGDASETTTASVLPNAAVDDTDEPGSTTPEDGAEGGFEPGNRIDQELFEAVEAGDTDTFLRVLFAANVLVPIPDDAPLELPPTQPGFRWDAALRGASAVQVFTSLVRMKESLGGTSDVPAKFVYADFRDLIGVWPDSRWTMLLNPGTRIGASLAGDQVNALNEWAGRVGLLEPPTAPGPGPSQVRDTTAQAVPQQRPAPQPTGTPAPPPRPAGPIRMQKVLPLAHVSWYLDQGYDRVGGFVYPAEYTADLKTPIQLYETLGLLYAESPFSPGDDGVYIIRWSAYCEELYRTPFGGQSEEELRAWGDSGWVIERAPFQGAGFAPGSAGTIREYKVDSARLPHGAEMSYLSRDGSEIPVATYDPDRLEWVRPADAGNHPNWNGRTEAGGGQ